jgi:hypothetical protein
MFSFPKFVLGEAFKTDGAEEVLLMKDGGAGGGIIGGGGGGGGLPTKLLSTSSMGFLK